MPHGASAGLYVAVKIDFVHQNAKDIALPIPLPEADIYTLGDAVTKRIQWKNVWTSAHSKFVMGKPMLSELDLANAGVNT